jgi:hypothetical protein
MENSFHHSPTTKMIYSQKKPTGKFDLLGNPIFTHDLVNNILLGDYIDYGHVGEEILQIDYLSRQQ